MRSGGRPPAVAVALQLEIREALVEVEACSQLLPRLVGEGWVESAAFRQLFVLLMRLSCSRPQLPEASSAI